MCMHACIYMHIYIYIYIYICIYTEAVPRRCIPFVSCIPTSPGDGFKWGSAPVPHPLVTQGDQGMHPGNAGDFGGDVPHLTQCVYIGGDEPPYVARGKERSWNGARESSQKQAVPTNLFLAMHGSTTRCAGVHAHLL
jgi:hypothetical protein